MSQAAKVGTILPSRVLLTECRYCGKFTLELDRHGPGRCWPSHADGMAGQRE